MRQVVIAILGIFLALAGRDALALACTSTGANWNTAGNWSCARVPTTADTVTINSNMTVNVATANVLSVTVNAGRTLTQSSALNTAGTLSVAGTLNSTNSMAIGGATTVTGALNITAATGTHVFTGTVTITGGTWNNSGNEPVSFGADLSNSGTFTSGTGTQTFTAGTATLSGNAAITVAGNLTANGNLTINKTAGAVTSNATAGVAGNLTVTAGTINFANATTITGTTGVTGTLSITNATGAKTFTGTVTVNAGGTWNNPAGDAIAFGANLTNSGSFTGGNGVQTVAGGLTQSAGTFTTGTAAFNLAGDFTFGGGTFTTGTGAFTFDGAGAQALTGTTSFVNIAINKAGGTLTLNSNVTATTTLNLQAGTVTTGGNSLSLLPSTAANGCSTAGALARNTGYVIGNLQYRFVAGTSTCVFHIGDASGYTPVTVAMRNLGAASPITARTDTPDHAGVTSGAAGIDPSQSVNRYWTLTSGLVFGAATQYDATFRFLAADVDAGATTGIFEISRLSGGTWFGTPAGTRTATTTQAVEQTAFGVFAIGELINVIYAEYRMEEPAGLLGPIADSSGNSRNGVRLGNADTVLPVPANPISNICRGLNIPNNTTFAAQDALDTGFDMNAVGDRGTITFWYKSAPLWNGGGDRQLLDASASTAQVFSLILSNNGRLTLSTSDTTGTAGYAFAQNATSGIAANTWAHIGVTWNFTAGTFQIYVNGALVASTLTTFGAPNGAVGNLASLHVGDNRLNALIGGGLNTANSANGVIDEVRVYRGVRTLAQIGADRTASFPVACDVTQIPGRFNAFETSVASTSTTGSINTKVSGANATVKLVAVNAFHTAVDTTFAAPARIEVLDASNDSGALDANKCRSTWTPVTLPAPTVPTATFTAGVSTPYTFVVPDAYRKVRLRISYPASAPVLIGCTLDNFAVRPASLSSIVAQDQTWTTPYTTGTPRALDNSTQVHKAGQDFSISATGLNNVGVVTANYDGSPTVVAASTLFTGPNPSPAECSGPNPPCAPGTLTPGAFSAAGSGVVRSSTANYNEVGAFAVQFEDTTFANIDAGDTNPASTALQRNVPASSAVTIGRFVPNHFVVTPNTAPIFQTFGAASSSCSGSAPAPVRSFTYVGQDFNWQTPPKINVVAKEKNGATTALYRGALFKVGGSAGDITYTYAGGATFAASPATATVTPAHDGTGTATAGSDSFRYTRNNSTPLAPFTASINMTMGAQDTSEADGAITTDAGSGVAPAAFNNVAFDGGDFNVTLTGGKTFLYGRARMLNAYGPTTADLPITVTNEYYTGTFFATNAKDHCTSFSSSNFQLSYPAGSTLTAVNLGVGHISISGTLLSGAANLRLTKPAPTPASPGSAQICLDLGADPVPTCTAAASASKAYLQGPWSSANYDDDPSATAGFGIFGSQPRNFIFQRENF